MPIRVSTCQVEVVRGGKIVTVPANLPFNFTREEISLIEASGKRKIRKLRDGEAAREVKVETLSSEVAVPQATPRLTDVVEMSTADQMLSESALMERNLTSLRELAAERNVQYASDAKKADIVAAILADQDAK